MFRLIGKLLFFFIRFIIHLPFAVFHGLRRFFFGVNFDKMNGYEFEEYAARYLKRNGYSKITVTKASRDFGVDLIAKKHRTTYAVQCKLYQGKVGNSAVQEEMCIRDRESTSCKLVQSANSNIIFDAGIQA